MQKLKKNIILLMLFAFGFFGLFHVAYADEKKNADKENLELSDMCIKWKKENTSLLKDSYGISISYIPKNTENCALYNECKDNPRTFELSMEKKSKPNNSNYVFKLSKIELVGMDEKLRDTSILKTYEDDEIIEKFGLKNVKLSLKQKLLIPNITEDTVRFRFTLVPDTFNDATFVKNCGSKAVMEIYVDYDYYGEPIHSYDPAAEIIDPTTYKFRDVSSINSGIIDCSKSWDSQKNSFEYSFCRDKKLAEDYGKANGISFPYNFTTINNTYAKFAKANNLASTVQYKCDAFAPLEKSVTLDKNDPNYDYYSNKSYLYGTIDYIVKGEYVYHYGGHKLDGTKTKNAPDKEYPSCTVRCDEVVTTEYGPPVASKAGLCFEYKVKVTSRVNCHVVKYPEQPKINQGYCTPAPGCDHGNGYVDPAAGPTEDFEACIDKCDGGKYTDKCSKKCYNEVYGTLKSNKTSLLLDYSTKDTARLLSNTQPQNTNGVCTIHVATEEEKKKGIVDYYDYGYYYAEGDYIKWDPDQKLGRWYCMYLKGAVGGQACIKTSEEGGGISAVCGCSARCLWVGCSVHSYLNANESLDDDKQNIINYNKLVDECISYSKCSTTQAEFSIDVDYTYGEKNVNTKIYFPYTSKNDSSAKDTIIYNREKSSVTCTTDNANTTILQSNGCYTCTKGDEKSLNDQTKSSNNWYQTEWSFPGTWIHNKTGEISYTPVTKQGWLKYERKFCIPLDANNVNQKWWNAYYISRYGKDKVLSYFGSSTINDKCSITSCENGKFTKADKDSLKYNINAHTRKFGLLDWDIDISCFYALNNNFPKHESGSSCTFNDAKCLNNEGAKKIRSVELTNLFPATDGAVNSSPDSTGRTPGFNWSIYATNIIKDQAYTSRPANYVKWVQKKGYNVYSDEYLDYEFNLTKADIQKLKREGQNYTAFNGETMMNSVINYQSSLFRGNNAIIHSDKIPQINALKCNNIKNYRSDECDDFAEDGE